jgi:hypothetical protein
LYNSQFRVLLNSNISIQNLKQCNTYAYCWACQSLPNCRMVSSGMLRRVALVRTDVAEELSASFIRMTRIGELGTTLAVTSNRQRV